MPRLTLAHVLSQYSYDFQVSERKCRFSCRKKKTTELSLFPFFFGGGGWLLERIMKRECLKELRHLIVVVCNPC